MTLIQHRSGKKEILLPIFHHPEAFYLYWPRPSTLLWLLFIYLFLFASFFHLEKPAVFFSLGPVGSVDASLPLRRPRGERLRSIALWRCRHHSHSSLEAALARAGGCCFLRSRTTNLLLSGLEKLKGFVHSGNIFAKISDSYFGFYISSSASVSNLMAEKRQKPH